MLLLDWLEHAWRCEGLVVLWCPQVDEHVCVLSRVVDRLVLAGVVLLSCSLHGTLLGSSDGVRHDEVKAQLTWLHVLVLVLVTKATRETTIPSLLLLLNFG